MEGQCSRPRALRVNTVRGEPYVVGGRELIPVARVISFGKASGMVGARQVSGRGGGFVWVKPLAIIEVSPGGERRIPIRDGTDAAIRGILTAIVSMTLFFTVIRWLVRWKRKTA